MLEKHLLAQEVISQSEIGQIYKSVAEEVEEAVRFAEESPYPSEKELFHDVFKEQT
jgi:pyruvate dehydrogenase E1 component alpha subunit